MIYAWVQEKKHKFLAAEGTKTGDEEVVFQACKRPLPAVPSSKYLGRVLTFSYDDWVSVISNIRKDQKWWVRMLWIMGRYRTNMWVYGLF